MWQAYVLLIHAICQREADTHWVCTEMEREVKCGGWGRERGEGRWQERRKGAWHFDLTLPRYCLATGSPCSYQSTFHSVCWQHISQTLLLGTGPLTLSPIKPLCCYNQSVKGYFGCFLRLKSDYSEGNKNIYWHFAPHRKVLMGRERQSIWVHKSAHGKGSINLKLYY